MDDNKFLKEKIQIMSDKMIEINNEYKHLQDKVGSNVFDSNTFITNNSNVNITRVSNPLNPQDLFLDSHTLMPIPDNEIKQENKRLKARSNKLIKS